MQRLGLSLPLDGFSLGECVALAEQAERLGFTDVWTSEIGGADGLSLLAAIAVRTQNLRLGVAVVPVFTRPPALIAMSAASLQALSDGRFCLGLGSSTDTIVEQWMGLTFVRPLQRVRETIEAVQLAMSGNRVSYEGEVVDMRNFRLQVQDVTPVPILVAALGPRMLRLAAEVGDGVVLSQAALPAIPQLLDELRRGAEAAGRSPDDLEIVQRVGVAVDEDEAALRPILRRELAAYARTSVYNAFFMREGYGAEAAAIQEHWERGDTEAAIRAVSDRFLDETFIFGTAAACRRRLGEYRTAGLRTPVVIPISAHPDPDERKRRRTHVLRALVATD